MTPARRNREQPIDWSEVRRRLDQSARAMEGALRLAPERARQVMNERARALARAPAPARSAGSLLQVVVFALANERYALEARYVREVVRLKDFTPVPGSPDFMLGVTTFRGAILAVLDLRKFFGVAPKGLTDLSRVIVLGRDRIEFGVLADEVHDITALRIEDVLEPPGPVAGIGREYLRGVTNDALIILDGAALLEDRRLFIDRTQAQDPFGP